MPSARWRSLAGLAILLGAVAQAAQSIADDTTRLAAIGLTSLVMTIAWLSMATRRSAALSIWVLGAGSVVLMLLQPSTGAVIGIVAAIVNAALHMSVRGGAVAAALLGLAFLGANGVVTGWSSPINLAFMSLGLGFAYVATTSVSRVRMERERAEALLEELQRTRDAQIEAAALGERARIAREIHDVLAHTLSALAVQLEGTRMLVEQRPGDPATLAAVERAHRLALEGLHETRRAVGALRGDRLPGADGLARLVEEFGTESGTPARFDIQGGPVPLASDAQLALYRTAQEALTNVRKHAPHATSVGVVMRYTADGAELVVEDEAPPGTVDGHSGGGYGLVGMRERAELLGGTLEAGPVASGFKVRLWLPTK